MTREHETSLSYLHSLVSDVFNLLEVGLLIRIEHQLLEVHSSQPALNPQPRPCTFASAFPDACRCWTGGCPCPWGQGIKSMPMRSSPRQRKRSSRRPCRPHRSFCRGKDLRKDLNEWVVDHVPWGHHAPTNGTPTYYGPVLWSRMVHTLGG